MPYVDVISWRTSLVLAVAFLVAALLLRLAGRASRVAGPGSPRLVTAQAAAGEAALVLGMFALWQLAGRLARSEADGAFARAQDLWRLERAVYLPDELAVQHAVLPHPPLVQLANGYYLYGHLNVVLITLVWLFACRREVYPRVRNVLAVSTGACLLVQLVPIAPPRLLGRLGFTDTGLDYGQSVYGSLSTGLGNQLSAMPSLHIGWAVVVAWAVLSAGRGPWRWVGVVHLMFMNIVVVATANHWWLDGVVAAGIVAVTVVALPARLPLRTGRRPQQSFLNRSGHSAPA